MADVLSQNEIDNLLSGMSRGMVQVEDVVGRDLTRREATSYDFRRPSRLSKNQIRTFQSVHENFAEAFGYYLVSKLQTVVSINVNSVDQLFYSEFILSVSNPSCLYVFDIEGTDGSGILEISPQLAFATVERLLGGGTDAPKKSRAITVIEQAVVRGIIERSLVDLGNAWRSLGDVNFRFSRLETEADFVQIAPGSEIVLAVTLDVNISSNSYMMNLCFPTFALEEIIAQLNRRQLTAGVKSARDKEKSRENEELVRKHIATTHLPAIAELGRSIITVKDVMDLKVGDILKLNTKISQEIQLSIGGKRKFAVRPGSVNGKKAVRITRNLGDDDIVDDNLS